MPPEERAARTTTLLAEVLLEQSEEELEECKEGLKSVVMDRVKVNKDLKQKGMSTEQKPELNKKKEEIMKMQEFLRQQWEHLEDTVKFQWVKKNQAASKEVEVCAKRGKKERALRMGVEHDVLKAIFGLLVLSSHHGGDMEGPHVREMMVKGPEVLKAIADFLKLRRTAEMSASDDEIDVFCDSIGKIHLQLDSVFSLVNTKRGELTDVVTKKLEDHLDELLKHWAHANLSITPKLHALLDHIVGQLRRTGGTADMGES